MTFTTAIRPALLLLLVAFPAAAQEDPASLESQAIRAFEEGDEEAAIALYRRALEAYTEPSEKIRVAVFVSEMEFHRGRENAAINTLTDALLLDPDYPIAADRYDASFQQILRTAQGRAIIERGNRAKEYVQRAANDLRSGRNQLARDALEQALKLAPGLPSALYNLAYLDLRTGREDAALAGFERLIALGDRPGGETVPPATRAQAHTNLGFIYASREQYDEAAGALESAVAIDPDMPSAWLNLGLARRQLGDDAAAREAFERAVALAPDDATIVRQAAEVALEAGEVDAAVQMLQRAVSRHRGDAALWYTLARGQEDQGYDATASYQEALAADPDDRDGFGALAAFALARTACARRDATGCARHAEQALALRGPWIEAFLMLARARRTLGDLAGAQDVLERAVALDPARADVHNNLGDIYCRSRDPVRAEQSFIRALEIDPVLEAARTNLEAVRNGGCR